MKSPATQQEPDASDLWLWVGRAIVSMLWLGFSGLIAYSGIQQGRIYTESDRSRVHELHVTRKENIGGRWLLPDYRAVGRIAGQGPEVSVNVFKRRFESLRQGSHLPVYKTRVVEPLFVSQARVRDSKPYLVLLGIPITGPLLGGLGAISLWFVLMVPLVWPYVTRWNSNRPNSAPAEKSVKVPEEAIAKLYDLDGLRPGRHILRNEKGWREDEVWVVRLWQVTVFPSFDPFATLTTVHFQESEFRGIVHPARIRTSVVLHAGEGGGAVMVGPVDVAEDTVAPLLRNVNLCPEEDSLVIDGIAYDLAIQMNQVESSILIRNPREAGLVAIESALFGMVNTVQRLSGSMELKGYLEKWEGYLHAP